jgi:hypothetical protein
MTTDQRDRPIAPAPEHLRKQIEALKYVRTTALIAQSCEPIGAARVRMLVDYIKENPDGGPAPGREETVDISRLMLTHDNVDVAGSADYMYEAGY